MTLLIGTLGERLPGALELLSRESPQVTRAGRGAGHPDLRCIYYVVMSNRVSLFVAEQPQT